MITSSVKIEILQRRPSSNLTFGKANMESFDPVGATTTAGNFCERSNDFRENVGFLVSSSVLLEETTSISLGIILLHFVCDLLLVDVGYSILVVIHIYIYI